MSPTLSPIKTITSFPRG